jgi:hypothetical protein
MADLGLEWQDSVHSQPQMGAGAIVILYDLSTRQQFSVHTAKGSALSPGTASSFWSRVHALIGSYPRIMSAGQSSCVGTQLSRATHVPNVR